MFNALILALLLILIYGLYVLTGYAWTSLLVSIASLFVAIPYKRLKRSVDSYVPTIRNSFLGSALQTLITLPSRLMYFDLSLIIVSIIFLSLFSFDSLVGDVQDMAHKGFVIFPDDKDGFIHLQVYAAGYIFLPTFAIALALYGFNHGFQFGKMFFWRLFGSISIGLLLSVTLISLSRGRWTGVDNLTGTERANSTEVPVGAQYFRPFIILGLLIFFLFLLSGYVSIWSFVGRQVEALLGKRKTNKTQSTPLSPTSIVQET
jgi:hypothetical protein